MLPSSKKKKQKSWNFQNEFLNEIFVFKEISGQFEEGNTIWEILLWKKNNQTLKSLNFENKEKYCFILNLKLIFSELLCVQWKVAYFLWFISGNIFIFFVVVSFGCKNVGIKIEFIFIV